MTGEARLPPPQVRSLRTVLGPGACPAELEALSAGIDPAADPPTAYYPLTKPGERFPVNDPAKAPVLEPRPASRQAFLHGILRPDPLSATCVTHMSHVCHPLPGNVKWDSLVPCVTEQ